MQDLPLPLRCYLWAIYLATAALCIEQAHLLRINMLRIEVLWQPAIFVILAYMAQRMELRIKRSLGVSQATVVHIATILLFPQPLPLVIALIAILSTEITHPRPIYKRLFNICHDVLMVGLSSIALSLISKPILVLQPDHLLTRSPTLALVLLLYYSLDAGIMVGVFALLQHHSPWRVWGETARHTVMPEMGSATIGILVAVVWHYNPLLLVLFTAPALSLRTAFKAIGKAERRGEQLEAVLNAARRIRLLHDEADILLPAAQAAKSITSARQGAAYLRDPEHPAMLERLALDPDDGTTHDMPARIPLASLLSVGADIREETVGTTRIAMIPLEQEDVGVVGALRLSGIPAPLSDDDRDALTILAVQTSAALGNAHLHKKALAQASEDGLTGLLNHRAFQMRLDEEIARAKRNARPLSLIMVDLDNFGTINNGHGHQIGDAALLATATALRAAIRAIDIPARYGGDELAVIVPEADIDEALAVAERIRVAIAAVVVHPALPALHLSASLGVAALPCHADTRERLIRAADDAAYAAKRAGKNAVCRYEQAVLSRDPDVLATQLEHANMATVEALAAAVDAKDAYTRGHSGRVSGYAVAIAAALGFDERAIARVRLAGLLHDVGKIGVPDAILTKPAHLTEKEFALIKQHPVIGERMLAAVPFLDAILPAVRHHHERYDGNGYPDRLAGAAIPQDAAILAVADAFDAMTSSRTYRPALPWDEACRRIREGSGTQFDPAIVAAFDRALAHHTITPPPAPGTSELIPGRVA